MQEKRFSYFGFFTRCLSIAMIGLPFLVGLIAHDDDILGPRHEPWSSAMIGSELLTYCWCLSVDKVSQRIYHRPREAQSLFSQNSLLWVTCYKCHSPRGRLGDLPAVFEIMIDSKVECIIACRNSVLHLRTDISVKMVCFTDI